MLRYTSALLRHRVVPFNAGIGIAIQIHPQRQKSIRSWFKKPKQPKQNIKSSQKQNVIIEEEDADRSVGTQYIYDLKHYLKTTELPSNLRSRILSTKLLGLIQEVPNFASDPECLRTLNNVFMHLYSSNPEGIEKALPMDSLLLLFRNTSAHILSLEEFELPPFMATLSQHFMRSDAPVPTDIYALVIDLGASLKFNGFEDAFSVVVRSSKSLPADFMDVTLEYFSTKSRLEIKEFEAILSTAKGAKPELINDDYCKHLVRYVETLFKKDAPNIHEYQDLNKNIYRIEELVFGIAQSSSHLSSISLLQLLKFFVELNSVVEYKSKKEGLEAILSRLQDTDFELVKKALLEQDLFDEAPCHILLIETSRFENLNLLQHALTDFIITDSVRYSSSLKLQAQLLSRQDEDTLQVLKEMLTADEKPDDAHDRVIEVLMSSGRIPPNGETMASVEEWFNSTFDELPSLKSFQYRLSRAIECGDREGALQIFQQSLNCDTVQWDQDSSPGTQLLLNKLICIVCQSDDSIVELFPTFRQIKSHMTSSCNAEALVVLSKKMVEEECVGDAIELLKRELPKMNPESPKRLLVEPTWAYAHKKLFDQLHEFTIGYTNEETFETNWVLYGELHKYFAVPFNTYLPAMKFFCKQDRLHAALVIFRKVKSLNELHGKHHYLPPSREMYMYLFRTFGDKLYEEGVIEAHEYLKMDVSLQGTDIELENCLLDAYSNLQNVGKARDLFLSMSSNPKLEGGVNEETARIMIKTYTYSDILYVKKFWNNLTQFGIFPDYGIFKQYLIAHVYHGMVDEAFKLVNEIDDYNIEFSSDLLLAMHNYCLQPEKQQQIVEWAAENHREDWDKLYHSGLLRGASKYMPDTNLLTGKK